MRQNPERELTAVGSGADGVTVVWTIAITPKWVGFLPVRWTGVFARPFLGFFLKRALK